MMIHYKIVLDSGYCSFMGSFSNREDAHYAAQKHNAHADAQKRRGDLLTLRRAVGVVKIIPKPQSRIIEKRRGRKKKRQVAPS